MIDLSHVQNLMEQEVSRKEFLRYIGIAILSVVGITNLIKNLSQPLQLPVQTKTIEKNSQLSGGYGISAYGR